MSNGNSMFIEFEDSDRSGEKIQIEHLPVRDVFNFTVFCSLVGEAEISISKADAAKLADALLSQLEKAK